MKNNWSFRDAKAHFFEFLRRAGATPQTVIYRGKRFEARRINDERSGGKDLPTFTDTWLSAPKVAEFKPPPRK